MLVVDRASGTLAGSHVPRFSFVPARRRLPGPERLAGIPFAAARAARKRHRPGGNIPHEPIAGGAILRRADVGSAGAPRKKDAQRRERIFITPELRGNSGPRRIWRAHGAPASAGRVVRGSGPRGTRASAALHPPPGFARPIATRYQTVFARERRDCGTAGRWPRPPPGCISRRKFWMRARAPVPPSRT